MQKGDVINWDTAKWDLANMTSEQQDISHVCKPIRPGHVVLPEMRNFTTHVSMCRKLRGGATVVKDMETQLRLSKEINTYTACRHNSSRVLGSL